MGTTFLEKSGFYKAREISRCKQSNGVAAAPENEQVDPQGSGKSRNRCNAFHRHV